MTKIILADATGREVGAVHPGTWGVDPEARHRFAAIPPARDFAALLRFMQGPDMPDVPFVGGGGALLDVLEEVRKGLIGRAIELPDPGNPCVDVSSSYLAARGGGWWERETLPPVYSPGKILVESVEHTGPSPLVRFRIIDNSAWNSNWLRSRDVPEDTPYTFDGGGEMQGLINFPGSVYVRSSGRRLSRRYTKKEIAASAAGDMDMDPDE